jgi:tripartite-type tricarboxylate transporter receptor subunit TctC
MQRRLFLNRSIQLGAAGLASGPLAALAQVPEQPITIVVGFSAGGSTDGVARMLADQLTRRTGRTVVVDNRVGALGRIAVDAVAQPAPGREAFLVAPFSSLLFSALTVPSWKRDIYTDLKPVANLTNYPLALAVSPQLGVNNLSELIQWLKANPQKQVFGTAGLGGQNHLLGLAMGKALGIPLQVVAYKGNAPLVTDLIGGHTPIGLGVAGDFMPFVESKQVQILSVFTAERSPLLPNIPTAKEGGLDLTSGDAWYGMWASPKMPEAQVVIMQKALAQTLAAPEFAKQLAERYSMTPGYLDGAALDKRLRNAGVYWKKVIADTGFTPDQ